MAVEVLEDKKRWDEFVDRSPQGLLFHRWDFLKIVERHSGYRFVPYGVYSGEELRCVFPFFVGRERGLTVMCSPPPYAAQMWYLGPAFDPSVQALKAHARETIFQQVTDEVCGEIDKIGPNYVSFTTVPNFLDVRFFKWTNFTANLEFTYSIDLEKSLDEIWASFSRRCRQNIKRVNKHSPEVQLSHDVRPMLDMWRPRFSERGMQVPLLSDSYLKELVATFPQDMTVYNVSIGGELAIAIVYCAMQKERYAFWVGGTSARSDLAVHEYIQWEVAQRAKAEGFKRLDLGGGAENLSRFKSKFDPVLEPYCIVERIDTLGKSVNFVWKKLSWAKKLVSGATPRAHR